MEADAQCAICTRPADPQSSCTNCRGITYCSNDCRAFDKSTHDILCASFQAPPPQPSASTASVLAVLFPADQPNPRLVRVGLSTFHDDETSIAFQDVHVAPLFPPSATTESLHEERNRPRGRETHSMLELWHAAASSSSTLEANASIAALAAAAGTEPHSDWRGPVVVLAMTRPTGFMVDAGSYRDVTPRDFRDVVDLVVDYGNEEHARAMHATLATLGSERVVEVDDEPSEQIAKLAEEESSEVGHVAFEMSG